MADLPISFSPPMVLALLADIKSQTRRLGDKPKYKVGDRLYVREGIVQWHSEGQHGSGYVRYRSDKKATFHHWPEHWSIKVAPPMHMLKTFSRMTLIVTGVLVQRVQEISEADAKAEGVAPKLYGAQHGREYTRSYITLWDQLHALPGTRWADNPSVAATVFNVVHKHIDQL